MGMKPYLKLVLAMVALALLTHILLAADTYTYTTNTTYTTNSTGPVNYPGTAPSAISSSNAVMVALNAQILLLRELLVEHQKRAASLAQTNPGPRAAWESELVNELQEKTTQVQKRIDQVPSWTGTNVAKAGTGEVDDELAFASRIEERLEQINQDLRVSVQQSMSLAMQMATNKSSDAIHGLSYAAEDNQRVRQQLQREQLDLELRKLEFRALRRVMQK